MFNNKVAIIAPMGLVGSDFRKRLMRFVSAKLVEGASYLTNTGNHLDISIAHQKPANLLTPLTPEYSKAFVVKEYPVLYANDFTLAWLLNLLNDMGQGSELYLELGDEKARESRNNITRAFLAEKLPRIQIEILGNDWVRMQYSEAVPKELDSLATIYRKLHGQFEQFARVYDRAFGSVNGADKEQRRKAVTRSFLYSMFGANQKSFIVEQVIRNKLRGASITGLDMGGGYGLMAAELALKDHEMIVVDYMDKHVEIGKWVRTQFGLDDSLGFIVGRIEDVAEIKGSFDLISYFGSLLYADRGKVADVLSASMRLLKPGGVLLVHEGPKESTVPGTTDYERRFSANELLEYLIRHAGQPEFYNMFTAKRVDWDSIKDKVIMAVIQKGS